MALQFRFCFATAMLSFGRTFCKCLLTVTGLALLSSCASVKVEEDSVSSKTSSLSKPKKVFVAPFSTETAIWNVDRDGDELVVFKKNASLELQRMLIERLPEIAPTAEAPQALPREGLLITGEFTRVNQGSRALRMIIGFGAGGTKVETHVKIYDLAVSSTSPVYSFNTTGGSNAQPGFIAGGWLTAPVYAGLNATGLQADWERTSREVRNFIMVKTGDYTPPPPAAVGPEKAPAYSSKSN